MKTKLLSFIKWLLLSLIAITLAACGGGSSSPSNNNTNASPITYVLPNGSTITVPVDQLSVQPGGTSSTILTLTGGTPGLLVSFSSTVSSSKSINQITASESIPITVTFNPSSLTSGGSVNQSVMTIKMGQLLVGVPVAFYVSLWEMLSSFYNQNITSQFGVMTITATTPQITGTLNRESSGTPITPN